MTGTESAERARRLIALLPFLSEQATIPLAELAKATGTDEATVAADVSLLSMCGAGTGDPYDLVGVYVEDGVARVFADLPGFEHPLRLTAVESRALATALESVGVDPAGALARRLADVAAAGPDLTEVARTVRTAYAHGGHAAVIASLSAAASEQVSVCVGYEGTDGTAKSVVVRPYTLYLWRGVWYLLCHSEEASAERTLRIDRITSVVSTGQRFQRPRDLPADPAPLPDLEALPRATIRFATDDPSLTEREWPGARFERREDGTVDASVPFAGTGWLARKVAAGLGSAEALCPPELRTAIARFAREALDKATARPSRDL
jgi:proteasome accessory factor C